MMIRFLKRYYLLVLFALMIPVSLARVVHNPRSVIWSDAEGYYKYLPAVFVLKDVHQMPAGSVAPLLNEKGEYLNKYTMGVAYFQLPFYLVFYATAASDLLKPEAIFHDAWALSVALSGLFTGFLGLWLLQLALRRSFRRRVVFWTLLSVFFGTNLFHYTTREMGMSHVYSFALMAFLVWYVPGFYRAPGWKNTLVMGAALGWIVLIRPTNIVVALFVLLWEVYDWPTLRERLKFLKYKLHLAPIAVLAGLAIWLPQLCYWHEMTGSWLRYSYTNEGFIYWKAPKIAEVLLDPQNGLFIYAPMAFLMLAGGGYATCLESGIRHLRCR